LRRSLGNLRKPCNKPLQRRLPEEDLEVGAALAQYEARPGTTPLTDTSVFMNRELWPEAPGPDDGP
jgi:hypothetical protein